MSNNNLYQNTSAHVLDNNNDYYISHPDFPGIAIRLDGSHTAKEVHEFCATMTNIITPNRIDWDKNTIRVRG